MSFYVKACEESAKILSEFFQYREKNHLVYIHEVFFVVHPHINSYRRSVYTEEKSLPTPLIQVSDLRTYIQMISI